jgi:hypothetical protein
MEEQFINLSILFDKGPKENRKHRREVMDDKYLDFNLWIRACEKLGGDEVDRICAEVDEEYKKAQLADASQEVMDEKQKTHSIHNQKDK